MCGRFAIHTLIDQLPEIFGVLPPPENLRPRFNIAPSQAVPVITNAQRNQLQLFQWGLVPFWAKDAKVGYSLINARADTVATKPSFREAFKKRRCLVLADGFYEWKANAGSTRKTPFHIQMKSGKPFAFAGLWEMWTPKEGGEPLHSCTLITTTPNDVVAQVHDRMPVILPQGSYDSWLRPEALKAEELSPLLVPYPAEEMEAFPVSTAVNSPKNDGAHLMARVEEMPPPAEVPASSQMSLIG
jgi:putative SOS response-associated peptidase YedK